MQILFFFTIYKNRVKRRLLGFLFFVLYLSTTVKRKRKGEPENKEFHYTVRTNVYALFAFFFFHLTIGVEIENDDEMCPGLPFPQNQWNLRGWKLRKTQIINLNLLLYVRRKRRCFAINILIIVSGSSVEFVGTFRTRMDCVLLSCDFLELLKYFNV